MSFQTEQNPRKAEKPTGRESCYGQKKFSTQKHEHPYTKPLTEAFLKDNPSGQKEPAISLEDIKAAVART